MDTKYSNLIERAASFAADKHRSQKRKAGNLLYISHLVSVALILQKYNFDEEIIAAGLLHDTIEDTDTTKEEIQNIFGEKVLQYVLEVTEDKALPRQIRKDKYLENLKTASEGGRAIALADKIHNLKSYLFSLQEAEKVGKEEVELFWSKFSGDKNQTLVFFENCLNILSGTTSEILSKAMIGEFEILLGAFKKKYF